MGVLVTAAVLMALTIELVVGNSCRTYNASSYDYCGRGSTVTNPNTIQWKTYRDSYYGYYYSHVKRAYLQLSKVSNAWNQVGCLRLEPVTSAEYRRSSSNHYYTLPSTDYNSLYVARLVWFDSNNNSYYLNNSDCYFIPQRTPSTPQNVRVVHTSSSTVSLVWDKPVNHDNKVTRYQIENTRGWSRVIYTGTYYQWNGISPDTGFRVRAVSGNGMYGSWSAFAYNTTIVPSRPQAPLPRPTASIRSSTARSVTLNLYGCTSTTVKYVVRYSSPRLMAETTASLLEIKGLQAETWYTFFVTCISTVGLSGLTVRVPAKTKKEDTLKPVVTSVYVSNSLGFASISWMAPPSAAHLVTGYDIQVVSHGVGGSTSELYVGPRTSYDMYQTFAPETVYTFQVRAQTSVGTSQWSTPVVRSTLPTIPPQIDGFTASSPSSTSIALSWTQTTSTIDYYRVTLHNAVTNTTEHLDLYHTVNSSIFHDLTPNTAYSVAITAINQAGSGPTVYLNATTLGADKAVSPLAITTGFLGAMVVIVIVAVPLLSIGITWWVKGKKLNRSHSDFNCELRDNVAYFATSHNKHLSEGLFDMEEEEEARGKEEDKFASGKALEQLEPMSPQVPSRKYLKEKEKGPTVFASTPVFVEMGFKEKSGWYKPTVANVIAEKLAVGVAALPDLGPGVYYMCHRTKEQAKWVGLSPDLCRTLCGLFFQLYQKERSELTPLEVELKFFSPLAADWDIKVWTAEPKDLVLERAKKIVEYKTLKPLGLNNALKFTTKEMWEEFIGWFAAQKRQQ